MMNRKHRIKNLFTALSLTALLYPTLTLGGLTTTGDCHRFADRDSSEFSCTGTITLSDTFITLHGERVNVTGNFELVNTTVIFRDSVAITVTGAGTGSGRFSMRPGYFRAYVDQLEMPRLTISAQDVDVDARSRFTAEAVRNGGLGAGTGTGGMYAYGSGGGHGGRGGANGGMPYGDTAAPVEFGSKGGTASSTYATAAGGRGGGVFRISANGECRLDGSINVDGGDGYSAKYSGCKGSGCTLFAFSGGGSGGSVWITAGTFSGSGSISADGGMSGGSSSGGGAGGRIAIDAAVVSYTGTVTAVGSDGGEDGSIYYAQDSVSVIRDGYDGVTVPGMRMSGRTYNLHGRTDAGRGTGITIIMDGNGSLVKRLRLK